MGIEKEGDDMLHNCEGEDCCHVVVSIKLMELVFNGRCGCEGIISGGVCG